MDHQLHRIHMHAAGGDIGGDQHSYVRAAEGRKVPVALILREVAVQIHCRDALGGQLFGKLLRLVLGAGEENPASGARSQGLHQGLLLVGGYFEDVVGHIRNG